MGQETTIARRTEPLYIGVRDLAKRAGLSYQATLELVKSEMCPPGIWVGNQFRARVRGLDEYLNSLAEANVHLSS